MSQSEKTTVEMLLFSSNTVFEKMANITIFSLNVAENYVNIQEEVL